jgi:hypothetical protein
MPLPAFAIDFRFHCISPHYCQLISHYFHIIIDICRHYAMPLLMPLSLRHGYADIIFADTPFSILSLKLTILAIAIELADASASRHCCQD